MSARRAAADLRSLALSSSSSTASLISLGFNLLSVHDAAPVDMDVIDLTGDDADG